MNMTPELEQAFEKMKPGALSRDGFLGNDVRDLPAILAEQQAQCLSLGLDCRIIADAMRRIGRAGLAGFGAPVIIEEKWEVTADENRGKIPSPWPEPGLWQKTVYTVKNLRSGKTVRYSELSIHLIEQHCFFQGRGASFHNEPADLAGVLELVPPTV